jgi:two-component system, NarL family, sensor kinase
MSRPLPAALRSLGPAFAVAGALAAPAVLGQLLDPAAAPIRTIGINIAIAASAGALGALVLKGKPGHLVGRLLVAAGIFSYVDVVAASWSSWAPLAWLGQWLWWPPYGLVFLALLCFPDGRLPSRRWVWVWLTGLLSTAIAVTAVALAAAAIYHPKDLLMRIGHPLTGSAALLLHIAFWAGVFTIGCFVPVAFSLMVRWRRSDGETRMQLACVAVAAAITVIALLLEATPLGGPWAPFVIGAAVPVAMTVAILSYGLYGLDWIVNRALVWLVMSLLLLGGFCAVVVLLGGALAGSETSAALAVTIVIALAFEPARRGIQRLIDRMLYGDSSDSYQVLARLGELLSHPSDQADVLSLLTKEIARAMRVPYVAVRLPAADGQDQAAYGENVTEVETFAMTAHGETVGQLLVAPRRLGERFTARERRLLVHGALHAAVAVRATRLVHELEASRQLLNAAEERERKRIRRDLHDGVRPALRGLILMAWAARRAGDLSQTRIVLDELSERLKDCDSELHEVIEDLRPAALANGLPMALRAQCESVEDATLAVELQVSGDFDDLPPTIEKAAYRIVTEALQNVARHAHARTCQVTVDRSQRTLVLEIADDGVGFTCPPPRSSGLTTMMDRAHELGGKGAVASDAGGGTIVKVWLPLAGWEPH